MANFIPDYTFIFNGIALQSKTSPNSLTVAEWNRVVNSLSAQTNNLTQYIVNLHKFLFGESPTSTLPITEEGLLHALYVGKADLDSNTRTVKASQAPMIARIVPVETLEDMTDPKVIYLYEGKQYRYAPGKGLVDVTPGLNEARVSELIAVIDGGEYNDH